MARLEYIHYSPQKPVVVSGVVVWQPDTVLRSIEGLPQLFWKDGSPWREANLWAVEMGRDRRVKVKTIDSLFYHLHKYANWLEEQTEQGRPIDWRHFPQTRSERVLNRFRGDLIEQRDAGVLKPSTTTARMGAVIRFYRYAAGRNFISRNAPKWQDKAVVVSYFDDAGFGRTMDRVTTDLSIPNRARHGARLEDSLLPITVQHMTELLDFTKEGVSEELDLMLKIGFYTGARLGTITTLRVKALFDAVPDPAVPGMWSIPVGPGTGIDTKFDVSGHLMLTDILMKTLKVYATSRRHLDRVIKATDENKSYLFLTRHFNPYTVDAVDREMVTLRRAGQAVGLKFLQDFKFHQSRATFGTWLMSICLETGTVKAAIEFVKGALLHKDERDTFRYVTFIEQTKTKIEMANAFTRAFLGKVAEKAEAPNA
jgi:integrase